MRRTSDDAYSSPLPRPRPSPEMQAFLDELDARIAAACALAAQDGGAGETRAGAPNSGAGDDAFGPEAADPATLPPHEMITIGPDGQIHDDIELHQYLFDNADHAALAAIRERQRQEMRAAGTPEHVIQSLMGDDNEREVLMPPSLLEVNASGEPVAASSPRLMETGEGPQIEGPARRGGT